MASAHGGRPFKADVFALPARRALNVGLDNSASDRAASSRTSSGTGIVPCPERETADTGRTAPRPRSLPSAQLPRKRRAVSRSSGDTGWEARQATGQDRHFSLTTGSSPWSFWRRRVPRQSASALGPHVVRRPSKALEGYSPFKTTDLRDPVLGEIAERQGVTPAHVVIRWHIDQEVVVIPKSASPERIASNFDVFGFALDDAERQRIDGLSGDVCGDKQPPRSFRIFHTDYCP